MSQSLMPSRQPQQGKWFRGKGCVCVCGGMCASALPKQGALFVYLLASRPCTGADDSHVTHTCWAPSPFSWLSCLLLFFVCALSA
jgi:hypothetical protein